MIYAMVQYTVKNKNNTIKSGSNRQTVTAVFCCIGGDAIALDKSMLEKTGGSLFGKAVAAGADNALLNMPQNVVNGLTDSVSPTDALKNIGSSELEDFAAGGLLGGALSALSKPIGALGKAADDTAIDNLLNDATKVDRTAIPVYNEGIGNELPDTREFSNSSESLLPETKISTIPDTLGGEANADTAIDRLFNDATKADNLSDEGAGDYSSLAEKARNVDVSTSAHQAVFYSGKGNRARAEGFAELNGKMTLEMTPGGKYFDSLKLFEDGSPVTKDQAYEIWKILSERYAKAASGNVYGFVKGSFPESIFNTVEYPTLQKNPYITNIFTELHN